MPAVYINYAEYERRAAREIARLGLPASHVDYSHNYHLKPKPSNKAYPRNGRRGRRASMPRHSGGTKRTGN